MTKNPYTRRVKEVMSTSVVAANAGDTVHEALVLLDENRVNALPVLDHRGCCIGMISSTDFLELTRDIEDDLEHLSDQARLGLIDLAAQHSMGERNISELMSERVATVTADATLKEAAAEMLRNRVHRLPVVDEKQQLLGIVSTIDILEAFVDGQG